MTSDATMPPFRLPRFAPAAVNVETRSDGTLILRSPQPLAAYPQSIAHLLRMRATDASDRVFLADRATSDGSWRRWTYAEVFASARAIGQALLQRGLGPERPVLILSDNSVDHALVALGAMMVGVPAVPISQAYSIASKDLARLRFIVELLSPGLVFADDGTRFERALRMVAAAGAEVVVSRAAPDGVRATALGELLATVAGPAVDAALATVNSNTIAKILFTSGSTGEPKGVINTHGMLCSNQQAIAQCWPFLADRHHVVVDWLPWSHTFGGNHNFNMVLWHAATLHIDAGKPAPGLIETTVANLREISPTLYFNVPRGFDMLLTHLERDPLLSESFFRDLDLIFYAAAALPQNLWERLERAAVRARGHRVCMVSAWGSTETAPMVTTVHFALDRAGVIGLPAPGVELKMIPDGARYELRVRGPNVTPGYWRRADLTAAAFDSEGYYCIGDAGRFVDPTEPARGVVFDGRVAEDFKLSSGTWVRVGALRIAAIAAGSPMIQDAVLTGHDREFVGLLVFPNAAACAALVDGGSGMALADLLASDAVVTRLQDGLRRHNASQPGGSTRIARVVLLDEAPSMDANEITDKGYLNQRAVLERRAALVAAMYAERDPRVIEID